MITYKELLEKKKQPDFTIRILEPKDASKSYDAMKKNKIKFMDVNSTLFSFKKEDQWDKAMDILDDIDVEYDFDG